MFTLYVLNFNIEGRFILAKSINQSKQTSITIISAKKFWL